jgi:hypothetical protein
METELRMGQGDLLKANTMGVPYVVSKNDEII